MKNEEKCLIFFSILFCWLKQDIAFGQCNANFKNLTKMGNQYFDNNEKPFTGVACEYSADNTVIVTKITYVNGYKNGVTQSFYANGNVYTETIFVNDTINKYEKYYYPDKKIFANFIYDMGRLMNISDHYYPDGKPVVEDNLKDGYGFWLKLNEDGNPKELVQIWAGKTLYSCIEGRYRKFELQGIEHWINLYKEEGKGLVMGSSSTNERGSMNNLRYYNKIDFDKNRNSFFTDDLMFEIKQPDDWLELWRRDKKVYIDIVPTRNAYIPNRDKYPFMGRLCQENREMDFSEKYRVTEYLDTLSESKIIRYNEMVHYKYGKWPEPSTFEETYGQCMECIKTNMILLPKKVEIYVGIDPSKSKHDLNPLKFCEFNFKKRQIVPVLDIYYTYIGFEPIQISNWDIPVDDFIELRKRFQREKIEKFWIHISSFKND